MKSLLKFVVLSAWLLFIAALWQNSRLPAGTTTIWALPSLGMLSISRKMTDIHPSTSQSAAPDPVGWASPASLFILPVASY